MKECNKCPVSAMCFSLGRKNFLSQVHECDRCRRTFYRHKPVSLPCHAFWEILNTFGDESIAREKYESGWKPLIPIKNVVTCGECWGKQTVIPAQNGKEPEWLP